VTPLPESGSSVTLCRAILLLLSVIMADPGTCIDCALDAALSDAVVVSQEAQVKPAPAATNGSGESLLDPATFVPPKHPIAPSVTIEFCNRQGTVVGVGLPRLMGF
jgi:hypothetical protein